MIKSFGDKTTANLFERKRVRELPSQILRIAYRKLLLLDAAGCINDLRIPPGNRLEKPSGKLAGKYSIRINEKWRIIFIWKGKDALNVQISDYHEG